MSWCKGGARSTKWLEKKGAESLPFALRVRRGEGWTKCVETRKDSSRRKGLGMERRKVPIEVREISKSTLGGGMSELPEKWQGIGPG